MVDEEADEGVDVHGVHVLARLREVAELHLVLHVVHLLLRRVVAHSTHKVRQLVQGDGAVEPTRLGRVLVLATDHRVVEEVFHVLVGLAITTSLDEVDEWFDPFTAESDSLIYGRDIDRPHVNSQVLAAAREQIFAIAGSAYVFNDIGVCDETHGLIGVAIKGHLDQSDDLLLSGVYEELVGVVLDVEFLQLDDLPAVGGPEACAAAVLGADVPYLHLVVVVGGKEEILLGVDLGVPDAGGGVRLLLDLEHGHHLQALLLRGRVHVVLEDAAVTPDGEQTQFGLLVLVQALPEGDGSDFDLVGAALPMELPFNGLGRVPLQVVLLKQAHALVGVHRREIFTPDPVIGNDEAQDLGAGVL